MQPQKTQKIDLNAEYPCPCRRRGRLQPIALTEAFGCDRCQQIFVVEESRQAIEQLSTSYPCKKAWRWTGHRWTSASSGLWGDSYLPIGIGVTLLLLLVWLPLALRYAKESFLFWALLAVLLAVIPSLTLMFWLSHRR